MNALTIQTSRLDRIAMGLSGLCLVHCVATTVMLALLSAAGGMLGAPIIHEVGLTLAMIMGAFSLGRGILEHGYSMPSAVGGLGLGVMAGALTLPHDGTEALYTVMGQGCESVTRTKTDDTDVVVGKWSNGRTGTLIGLRTKATSQEVTVFGTKAVAQQKPTVHDYAPLVGEIIKFFQSGKAPVPMEETLEMFAFMEAADESAKANGAPVKLADTVARAATEKAPGAK